jgi:phage terminase small subunit
MNGRAHGSSLTAQQKRFACEYLKTLNASQAAVSAGYTKKNAGILGYQLLKNPLVANYIQQQMDRRAERLEISADKVLQEIAKLSYANTQDLYDEYGELIPIQDLPRNIAAAVQSIEVSSTQQGTVLQKIKLHDKRASLELLGKHLVLFTDKKEITGPDGVPLFQDKESESERARRTREMMLAELGDNK